MTLKDFILKLGIGVPGESVDETAIRLITELLDLRWKTQCLNFDTLKALEDGMYANLPKHWAHSIKGLGTDEQARLYREQRIRRRTQGRKEIQDPKHGICKKLATSMAARPLSQLTLDHLLPF